MDDSDIALVSLDDKSRLVIPKKMRMAGNFKPNNGVLLFRQGEKILMKRFDVKNREKLEETIKSLNERLRHVYDVDGV